MCVCVCADVEQKEQKEALHCTVAFTSGTCNDLHWLVCFLCSLFAGGAGLSAGAGTRGSDEQVHGADGGDGQLAASRCRGKGKLAGKAWCRKECGS